VPSTGFSPGKSSTVDDPEDRSLVTKEGRRKKNIASALLRRRGQGERREGVPHRKTKKNYGSLHLSTDKINVTGVIGKTMDEPRRKWKDGKASWYRETVRSPSGKKARKLGTGRSKTGESRKRS